MRLLAPFVAMLAFAVPAHAETKVLSTSGSFNKASNWTPAGKPGSGDALLIPTGKTAELLTAGSSGNLTVEGVLKGPHDIRVNGTLEAAGGTISLGTASLTVEGLGTINLGGNVPDYLRLKGIHRLTAPVTVGEDMDLEQHASLNGEGFNVSVPREFYSFLFSSLIGGTGTWRVGQWFIYAGPWDEGQEAQLEDTTVIVDRPVIEEPIGTSSFACLCGWTYKNFTLEGYEPQTYGSGFSTVASGGTILDTFSLNRSTGGIELAGGSTITAGALASNATVAEPVRVFSSEPANPVRIVCGCSVPAGVLLEGVEVV